MANQFTDKYKTLPTVKLLEIIKNSSNYQALAVETAKQELACRNDIEIGEQEFIVSETKIQQQVELEQKKRKNIEDNASQVFDYVDPFTRKTPEKSIVILCVLLSILFLYKTFTSIGFITLMFTDISEADYSTYWFFIEFFFLPVCIFFLWRKTKTGWLMFLVWLIYQILMDVSYLYVILQLPDVDSGFSHIIQLPSAASYILILTFHIALVYFICKPSIKSLFINKKDKLEPIEIN